MPFSNRPFSDASSVQQLPILQERYALRRCMADTALGKLYWAQDLKQTQGNGEQANVLVFTLLPALAQNPVFEQAFGHVLPTYQKPIAGMPHVTDDGKTADGTRWMVMCNIGGMLLSERLAELDDRGMPVPEALTLLENLSNALASQRPDGVFGYLEPDAVLLGEKLPCLLAAPVAAALRVAYSSTPNERSRQTLHSGYISPEVLLGDTPTAADDTFSIASLAYHLLQGEPPFGKQSALEAAVRNLSPNGIRKLRPDAWNALRQGLSLKRTARQNTPATLLRILQRKQQKKLLLPIAALVAASAVAMTTYHLLSSWGSKPPEQTETQVSSITPTSTQPANGATTNTTQNSTSLIGEQGLPQEAEHQNAATTEPTPPVAANDMSTLQDKAADAIRKGNLFSTDPNQPAAVDYLRKAVALEADNTKTQKLLAQLINDQHTEAEALLTAGKLEEASKLLSTTDRLITEFTLADDLKRQVSLETEVEQAKRKQALEQASSSTTTAPSPMTTPSATGSIISNTTDDARQYLERAQRAISFGNLSTGDDRSESAIAYLSTLLEKTPNQPEALKLLKKVVTLQQDDALTLLHKHDTDKARTALNDSQTLIGKYKLDDLVEEQITLEKRYRETLAMGVFKKEDSTPTTTSKPDTEKSAVKPEPATAPPQGITATPEPEAPPPAAVVPQETENPKAAEAAAAPTPPAPAPVEVRVSADIPVQDTAPPVAAELPAIQLDSPPAPQPAAPANRTFTPDVPDLIELPLDSIKDSLPPVNKNQ